jgi:flagellar basal-body rod protein FlgB
MSELGATEGGIFALAERKMAWLDTRQTQLAENIANADTPNYRARDVTPFSSVLDQFNIAPVRTSPLHLAGFSAGAAGAAHMIAERAPDGNAVGLEDEMTKVGKGETDQALVGNLWKTYMGMFMTALGKS